MKRDGLIRNLRRYARKRGIPFEVDVNQGKESHYAIKLGNEITTVQDGEFTPLMVRRIRKQLGIDHTSL